MKTQGYDRSLLLDDLAEVLSGLQVPLSIGVPLGVAKDPYRRILSGLSTFGYMSPGEYREALEAVLFP